MENQDFSTTILVDQSPDEVFNAVNNVRGWWSAKAKGSAVAPGDEFMVDFGSHWWAFRIVETVPGHKVVWQVSGSFMPWNDHPHEWTGTTVVFEIASVGAQTQLRFTHQGLLPRCSCFEGCSKGWTGYINISLKSLLATGTGTPDFPY